MAGIHIRLVLLHGLLVLLTAHAFVALGYIYDLPLAELYLETGNLSALEQSARRYEVNADRIDKFMVVQRAAPWAGALFGVVLSYIAIKRKRFSKLNVLVVLAVALVLALTGLLDNTFTKGILFAPGRLVSDSVATAYTFNYLLLLGLSFWMAFSRRLTPEAGQGTKV